ncbi:MAG: polysaccharide biosynthesis tyrosine autokinase [Desulfosarcina sp.]
MGKIADALEKSQPIEPAAVAGSAKIKAVKKLESLARTTPPGADAPPFAQHPVDPRLVTLLDPQGFESEQFKMLRTNLLFPADGQAPRSIMVTSALPGEGKSFLAANLAVTIAQNINEHVLLMDCDMRRPSVDRMFGFGRVPGLSEHLSQGFPLPSLLLKTGISKLTLLPAGAPPANPAELLSSTQMSNLLAEVKARYPDRHVIIDSPPPQLTAEAKVIARQVDGILIVVKYRGTDRGLVAELVENLGKEKVLGVVFNFFDQRVSAYKGKYGAYYGER